MNLLEEVSPAAALDQLRRRVRLLGPQERADRWQARLCGRLKPKAVDRLFFSRASERRAQRMCDECPALIQCALRALEEDARSDYLPEGTVGGLTATDRLHILLLTPTSERPTV